MLGRPESMNRLHYAVRLELGIGEIVGVGASGLAPPRQRQQSSKSYYPTSN